VASGSPRAIVASVVDRQYRDPRLARLYDPLCGRDHRRDFAFYLPPVMSAGAVLDVGCGTGALLRWARELGHTGRLVGLDPAEGMLRVARQRTDIEWVLGDPTTMGFDSEFDLIVMSGHAFQVFLTDDEAVGALTAMRTALGPRGRLAFETRNPTAREWEQWDAHYVEEFVDVDGTRAVFAAEVREADGDLVTFTTSYRRSDWSEAELSTSTIRFLDAPRLAALLDESGLVIVEQFGDWDGSPLTTTSPEIVTIARRR
jgi:ubiquinone/menaquinone biosynthesis C-methylase UbiE